MPKNIVYFLGAGASKSFGYPLTDEIMPLILERLLKHDLFQLDGARKTIREKQYERDLLRLLYLLYPGLRGVDINDINLKRQIPSITDILSIVDHFCFYNIPPHPEIADDKLIYFRNLLNRAVGELLLEFDLKEFTGEEAELFRQFIKPIRTTKIDNEVTIITTNYDLLIDYEFRTQLARNKVDYGIHYRNVNTSELIYTDPDPLFHYYKLHGSFNWLRCDLCGHYYINRQGSIVSLAFRDDIGSFNTCICSGKMRLKSVLVAPSLVRDIRDPNLLQIWKASMEAIRTADQLIMVGYSLPAEDLGIRSIIMRGLNGRSKSRPLEVDVVQLGDNAKFNYINLFGNGINYHPLGLKQYLIDG
jgi:hypothetical protein